MAVCELVFSAGVEKDEKLTVPHETSGMLKSLASALPLEEYHLETRALGCNHRYCPEPYIAIFHQ
jgi:hypothetical protein